MKSVCVCVGGGGGSYKQFFFTRGEKEGEREEKNHTTKVIVNMVHCNYYYKLGRVGCTHSIPIDL